MPIPIYSRVRILTSRFASEGVCDGTLGSITETYPDGSYEVEVSNHAGITEALVVAREDELAIDEPKRMSLSLISYLQSGTLGSICHGTHKDDIVQVLGPPTDVGAVTRKNKFPAIYKWRSLEVSFDALTKNRASLVQFEPEGARFVFSDSWEIRDWDLEATSTATQTAHFLTACGIGYQRVQSMSSGLTTLTVERSAVTFYFDEAENLHCLGGTLRSSGGGAKG